MNLGKTAFPELQVLYTSSDMTKTIKFKEDGKGKASGMHKIEHKLIQSFRGKTGKTQPLGRPSRSWENNIKMYRVYEIVDWIHLTSNVFKIYNSHFCATM
jgi:hypothetical protein